VESLVATACAATLLAFYPTMKLTINGQSVQVNAPTDTPLLWVLRDELSLTGTKYGCGIGQCGACTVHIDGSAQRCCTLPIGLLGEKKIGTIEGLSPQGGALHPVQQAWMDCDVVQCGYCQSGQVMCAAALLKANPKPNDAQIDEAMKSNLCRCGTYERIRQGVHRATELAAKGAR
jgi:isoquinoline 1-oxidoreductase alpha subunit